MTEPLQRVLWFVFEDTELIGDQLPGLGAHGPGDGEALLPVHDPLHRHGLSLAAGLEPRHAGLRRLRDLEQCAVQLWILGGGAAIARGQARPQHPSP